MKAVWGNDYDYIMDKCYPSPVCPECEEPIGKKKDGLYHCFSCGKVVDVEDADMKEWFAEREEGLRVGLWRQEMCRDALSKESRF